MVGSVARMIESDRRTVTFTSNQRRARAKRSKDVTVAVVHVLNPATAARLETAQALGKSLRCAYRNGKVHVWTEEAR